MVYAIHQTDILHLLLLQVGVLMHEETSFTYAQTQKVNRERQLLQLTTEGLYDIQVQLDVVVMSL